MGWIACPRNTLSGSVGKLLARLAMVCALALAAPTTGLAQTPPAAAPISAPTSADPEKMLLEADQMVLDKDKNTVSAVGNVQIYYKRRVLQADRVTYDRTTKHVLADGHAKLTDEKGNVTYGSHFDITDDFRDGFIDSVEVVAADKTRFTSPHVERSAGQTTLMTNGAYTACEPCRDHPERPPFWQVKAARIIENQETHVVYFEDAWLVLGGIPVAYLPYFSFPDPSVTRKSGLLTPRFIQTSQLGVGVGVPYFFDLAPNYDLTLTPAWLSRQGFFGEAEWRQRLSNGSYRVRATGIDQQAPSAFLPAPYGASAVKFRSSLETEGQFYINDKWKWGWDITLLSDRFYLNDYKIKASDVTNGFYADTTSSIYLRGKDGRSYFDLSAYRFEGLTANDEQRQLPTLVPVLDYNRTIAINPDKSAGIGGELTIDANANFISRQEAAFRAVGLQTFDRAYGLYNICTSYTPGNCFLRGIGGEYSRASLQESWTRRIIDPIGEVWTPFVFARLDASSTALNTGAVYSYISPNGASTIANNAQPALFGGATTDNQTRAMAGVGLEYRFPFVSQSALGTQTITPIAQLVVRPNETIAKIQPNEDAQSLVFDETTLFAWNKYSGYDREEGGTRFNYGGQYSADFNNGGHVNVVGGQSIQLAGLNSFAIPDAANTGLQSGLDKKYSNYVLGETYAPLSANFTLGSRQQWDSANFQLTRLDALASLTWGNLTTNLDYGRYAAQPLLGWNYRREGVLASASYKLTDSWSVSGSLTLDLSRHFYDVAGQTTPRILPTAYGLGIAYVDTCTTFKINFQSTLSAPLFPAPPVRDETVLVELDLRTLGDIRGSLGVK